MVNQHIDPPEEVDFDDRAPPEFLDTHDFAVWHILRVICRTSKPVIRVNVDELDTTPHLICDRDTVPPTYWHLKGVEEVSEGRFSTNLVATYARKD